MRAYELRNDWSLDALEMVERPIPHPGSDEVLIKIKAASLNFRDLVMVEGGYGNFAGTLPLIPVSDACGEIVETGEDVTRVAIGDRVCPIFCQGWLAGPPTTAKLSTALGGPNDGVLTEYMCLPANGVVKVPGHLSDVEAASLPCAAITAWNAIVSLGNVRAGDSVLVQGTGGVALFALQFAKMLGAEIFATSSSDDKLIKAKELGADHLINYRTTPNWGKIVKDLTGKRGVDLIIDIGGTDSIPQSLRAIKTAGQISVIGVLSGNTVDLPLGPVVTQRLRLQAVTVGSREDFEAMNRAIDLHRLRPVIDQVFSFDAVHEAFSYLSSGKHFGKVGISIDQTS